MATMAVPPETPLSRLDENQSSLTWFCLEDAWRLWIAWTLSLPRL